MKYVVALLLLVLPVFTQADIPQVSQANDTVFNPPALFSWTPAAARDFALREAQKVGMTHPQAMRFVATLACESENFADPAIQSNYVRPDGTREQSYGYAQIFLPAHPDISKRQAQDPDFAIPWAAQGFKDNPYQWSCYKSVSKSSV